MARKKVQNRQYQHLAIYRIARDIFVGLSGGMVVTFTNIPDVLDLLTKVFLLLNLLILSYHLEITIHGKHN
jgi:hypothetical protein